MSLISLLAMLYFAGKTVELESKGDDSNDAPIISFIVFVLLAILTLLLGFAEATA